MNWDSASGLLGWDLGTDTFCLIRQAMCDFSMATIGTVLNLLTRLSRSTFLRWADSSTWQRAT